MKKTICLILLLLMPFAFADTKEESFTIPVEMKIGNWDVNVSVGNTLNSYSCNSSSTNTFNPTIYHNFTYECGEESQIRNFTDSVNILADNCKVMQDSYKDASTYYDLYVACKSSLSACEESKKTFQEDANKMNAAESEKNRLNSQLTEMERTKNEWEVFATATNSSLNLCQTTSSGQSSLKWLFGGIGIAIGLLLYHFKDDVLKKSPKEQGAAEFQK